MKINRLNKIIIFGVVKRNWVFGLGKQIYNIYKTVIFMGLVFQ